MKTLLELVAQAMSIERSLIESGGELTPELELELTEVNIGLPEKIDSYIITMDRLDAYESYWKNRAAQEAKIAKGCANARERLKEALKTALRAMSLDGIEGVDYRLKLTPAKPSLKINEAEIPADHKMVVSEVVPDKEKIRAALELGVHVPGAHLEQSFALRSYPNKGGKK